MLFSLDPKGPMSRSVPGIVAVALILASLAAGPVHAQIEQPARVAGTVERIDGDSLVVKSAGSEKTVRIASTATVFALVKATLADVKPGVFVGVGATPQPDDSQRAIRVVIFPESMRGLGEGHRPWDRPGTTMTNATVDTAVTSVDGRLVTVKYKGGEKKIAIGPETLIATYVGADRAELKKGASVTVNGVISANGEIEARRIVIDRTATAGG
jgi:hypothetical protein